VSEKRGGIELIEDPRVMQARARAAKAAGQRIAFVPTMGYLHEGHVSLLRRGRALGELLVLSIFVNPMQFGPREDLSRYPRDLAGDLAKAGSAGCDVAFLPAPQAMYPAGFQTRVQVTEVEQGLCGGARPGHFVGVATVVLKLINLVQPDVMLLGEKDYQQLQVIRRMARDLDLPVEILGCPLIRDSDGVALSSRNVYLSPAEREEARALSRALFAAQRQWQAGERRREALLSTAQEVLAQAPGVRFQYLELRDADTLEPVPEVLERAAVLLVAGHVGTTRLIDNVTLSA
jgi:pantoate--beta-alanine ligase